MKTRRTISNISYNTPEFFAERVQNLQKRRLIEWCYWIAHAPDLDEGKPHIHFVLQPSCAIDTFDLHDHFKEYDPQHPDKPLGVLTKWHYTNSIDDWLLYAVHDVGYLAMKGQRRNINYQFEDLQATDPDSLRADWVNIDRTKTDRLRYLAEAVKDGTPFAELVQSGFIPIAQRAQYEFQYNDLFALYRSKESNRKQPHNVDPNTGEVIDPAPAAEEGATGAPQL